MIFFLLVYLTVYPLVHYHAFRKVRAAFPADRKVWLWVAMFMAGMILAPMMSRLAERAGFEAIARFLPIQDSAGWGCFFFF